ncbi:MAG: DUF4271 domain-containing protein [Bacteroidota bacterium]
MEYVIRDIQNWDWVTLVLVGVLVILAVTRHFYPRRFFEFLMLPVTDKYFMLQGKGYEIKHPFNVLLFGVQVLSFSLFFFLFFHITQPDTTAENKWLFVQLLAGFALFVLAKYYLEKIIAHIFNIEGVINSYLYEKLSYASLISILALLGNVVFFFTYKPSKTVLLVFSSVLALLFLISLISSFKRNWQLILRHFFYFILYLCALEIAPYVILYKLWV